jgi:protein-S-isoprenylcysteine O-methyltransferase Ste14
VRLPVKIALFKETEIIVKYGLLILIYFFSLTLYGVFEIIFQRRFSMWATKWPDKALFYLIIPFYLAIYLSPVEFVLRGQKLNPAMIFSGFMLLCAGIIIRLAGLLKLKNNFSTAIETRNNSNLVTTGIYRYIRHPLYLASFMISAAGSLIFSCLFTWIPVLLMLVAVIKRINREEIFLNSHYPEYQEYSLKTNKLLPYIY